jgi:hypothetical protein
MTTPLNLSDNVGYVESADVYCYYTEYYGDGTIYGFQHLFLPNGELVRGAGKTKAELVALDVVREADPPRPVPATLVVVPERAEPVPQPQPQPEPEPELVPGPYVVSITHSDFTVEYKKVLAVSVKDSTGRLTFSVS